MNNHVLITGGTGLIGTRLSKMLLEQGYQVSHLSRSYGQHIDPRITTYQWDITKKEIDPQVLQQADYVIHLAGAGVADQRWTEKRKEVILKSRTDSTQLLHDTIANLGSHHIRAFIGASAIGLYGADTGDQVLTEESPAQDDFLSEVVQQWEAKEDEIAQLNIRTVKYRTGVVLSTKGGALVPIAGTVRWGIGALLGDGQQYVSWIHMEDMCRMYLYAIEHDELSGAFNAVAPQPVTNETLTRVAARTMGRPLWAPNVPAFVLKTALGDMASVVLGGNRVSSQKIEDAGFSFKFKNIDIALADLLK